MLIVAASISALAAIAADRNGGRHAAFYALKPLTTLLILALAAAATRGDYRIALLVALGLSLAGDVCLMFTHRPQGTRWFLAGLVAFLLAHLGFVAAFLQGVGEVRLPPALALVAVYAALMLAVLLPRAGSLKLPVIAYCAVLAGMVFAAAARVEAFGTPEAVLALAGALLFLASDSLLGWRRFVGPFRHAQAAILSTYWAAIGLIACSG